MFLIEISFVDEVNVLNLCRPLPEPSNPLLTVAVGQAKKRVQFNIKKFSFFRHKCHGVHFDVCDGSRIGTDWQSSQCISPDAQDASHEKIREGQSDKQGVLFGLYLQEGCRAYLTASISDCLLCIFVSVWRTCIM